MKVTVKWLSDYVKIEGSIKDLVDQMTLLGLEVEGHWEVGDQFSDVIVGQILQVMPHPNADRLRICHVTDGNKSYDVICGAPNVKEGMKAPLAVEGAKLPAGTVRRAKIRGVSSSGMLVSKRELGLSEDHSGIYQLPEDTELGLPLQAALNVKDTIIDISVTPNRPDCLSMIGVAREIAAANDKPYKRPDVAFEPVGGDIDALASVTIDDPDLCPRYTGILVKDVTIGPSPDWMVRRLEGAGIRSINNIVDITNFVNLEVGQPLHAFDFDFLEEHRIVVRRSKPKEKITTLDEQTWDLPDDSVLICDGKKPVALGGIMGGLNSLVNENTKDVFIEAAYFDPSNIRRTSKTLGLSSESSYRFERGIDVDGVPWALHRAARLMEELAGGKVVNGYIDNYPQVKEKAVITLRPSRANWVCGIDISAEKMKELLESIELEVELDGENLKVTVPAFRVDLEREIDLIEEVARLYGYDNIPDTMPALSPIPSKETPRRKTELASRQILIGLGMSETLNYAFTSKTLLKTFSNNAKEFVKVLNPLNEDFGYLRDNLLVGLCQNLSNNLRRQSKRVRLFEVRPVYISSGKDGKLPIQNLHVGGIIAGRKNPEGWSYIKENVDFYDLKGICEELLDSLKLEGISWKTGKSTFLDPEQNAQIIYKNEMIGIAGKLGKKAAASFDIEADCFVFEIDLSTIENDVLPDPAYKALSKYPMTTRDIAVVLGSDISAHKVKDAILRVSPELVQDVILFDIYTGDKVGPGLKSLAFSIRMQKDDSEVTENEAEKVMKKALGMLISRFDAKLRE